jgi:hypothetical protein
MCPKLDTSAIYWNKLKKLKETGSAINKPRPCRPNTSKDIRLAKA